MKDEKGITKVNYIVSLLPVFIMMILIFNFSAKTAVQSSESSNKITETAIEVIEMITGRIDTEIKTDFFNQVDHIIRKLAHLTEYALLAIMLAIHLTVIKVPRKKLIVYNILLCALYATSDEIHQLFSNGRGASPIDVGIDTIGASLGTLFFLFVFYIVKRKVYNKK